MVLLYDLSEQHRLEIKNKLQTKFKLTFYILGSQND